jgi:dihydrofolate reductase
MNNISLIVAVSSNHVIGKDNALPWHLPEDLKRFRTLTTGHHIIMGRKTYESLGRLLPDRTTVIVTRNKALKVDGAVVVYSLQEAIEVCVKDTEAFIIGGAELYLQGLQYAENLYLTQVETHVEGDAFFPTLDENIWQETSRENHVSVKGLKFSYLTYARKKSQ